MLDSGVPPDASQDRLFRPAGSATNGPYSADVIERFLEVLGRYRRVILVVGVLLAVAYLAVYRWMPSLDGRLFPPIWIAWVVVFTLGVVAIGRSRAIAFEVRPEVSGFRAPADPANVLLVLSQLLLVAAIAGSLLRDLGSEAEWPVHRPVLVLGAVVMAVAIAGTWRGTGIELRPDGLRDREVAGILIVPWDALPVVTPSRSRSTFKTYLRVTYARPELVRRRGLAVSRRRLSTDGIDQQFAARAIRYYVTHPEHRAAIGTPTEHNRLLSEIVGPSHPTD